MKNILKKITVGVIMISIFTVAGVSTKADENTECKRKNKHHWEFNWKKINNDMKCKWNGWFTQGETEIKLLEESISLNEEVELKEIENLDIKSKMGEIVFKTGKTEMLVMELKHNIEEQYAPELEVIESEGKIEITNKSNFPKNYRYNGDAIVVLEITLPKSFEKNIYVDSVAGKVKNEKEIKLNEFKVEMAAGSIELEKLKVQNLELNCSAGRIYVSELESKDVDIELISGAVNTQIKSITGDMKFKVTSGSLKLEIPEESNVNVNVDAFKFSRNISGNIEILKDENSGFKGKLGDGKYEMNLSISAGKISLDIK